MWGYSGGRTTIRRNGSGHILRGAKIALFLLSVMTVTVLTSGIFTRPTQAEFLNTVVSCVLNIGNCKVPPAEPGDPTPPTDPVDPTDETPDLTISEDEVDPALSLDASPLLAGGTSETITITGSVEDTHLDSYSLAVNGVVAQQGSGMTETKIVLTIPWSVSTPERIPSGTYTIVLDAMDKAGNTAHKEVIVEVDNNGPTESVSGGDVIIKGGSMTPDVSASDAHDPITYHWLASGNNPAVLDFDSSASEPTFTPTVEGTYTFFVDIYDALGNVSSDEFVFSYARQLETVPLPTTKDPNDELIVSSPSTPSITPASTSPTSRSGRDEIGASDGGGVLGSTITAAQNSSLTTSTSITATDRGWSIFGVLWYWWLMVIIGVFAAAQIVKKIVVSRIPEQS